MNKTKYWLHGAFILVGKIHSKQVSQEARENKSGSHSKLRKEMEKQIGEGWSVMRGPLSRDLDEVKE